MENRQHPRVSMDHQCQAKFRFGGKPFSNIAVSDIGPEGCRLEIPIQTGPGFSDKSFLEGLELIHPALPTDPVQAKVVWVHGQDVLETGFVVSGVQFMDAPADYTRKLTNFVTFLDPPSTYKPH